MGRSTDAKLKKIGIRTIGDLARTDEQTVTCVNLGIGLAREGKKVLLIDADPQGSLTISLGYPVPDQMEYSLATAMMKIINDEQVDTKQGILHHEEGVDILPGNIELSGLESSLIGVISRETIFREFISYARKDYSPLNGSNVDAEFFSSGDDVADVGYTPLGAYNTVLGLGVDDFIGLAEKSSFIIAITVLYIRESSDTPERTLEAFIKGCHKSSSSNIGIGLAIF